MKLIKASLQQEVCFCQQENEFSVRETQFFKGRFIFGAEKLCNQNRFGLKGLGKNAMINGTNQGV